MTDEKLPSFSSTKVSKGQVLSYNEQTYQQKVKISTKWMEKFTRKGQAQKPNNFEVVAVLFVHLLTQKCTAMEVTTPETITLPLPGLTPFKC